MFDWNWTAAMNRESDIAVFLLALCSLAHKYNAKQICRSTAQVEMRIVYCAVVVGLGVCVRFVAYSRLLSPKCESLSGNKCVCSCIEIESNSTDICTCWPFEHAHCSRWSAVCIVFVSLNTPFSDWLVQFNTDFDSILWRILSCYFQLMLIEPTCDLLRQWFISLSELFKMFATGAIILFI